MTIAQWLRHHLLATTLLIIAIVFLIVLLGCLLWPSLFYDHWIWQYYWGPVVADARGHAQTLHGVTTVEGYTLVSELTYGIILILAIIGIYKLLKRLDIAIDWRFCLALTPYILFGPVTRVLEDTSYFTEPAVYTFISPLLYLQTAVYVFLFLFIGLLIERRLTQKYKPKTIKGLLALFFLFCDLAYLLLWITHTTGGIAPVHPGIFFSLSLIAFLPIAFATSKNTAPPLNTVIFSGGLLILLPCFFLIAQYILNPWSLSQGIYLSVLAAVLLIVTAVTTTVWAIGRHYRHTTLKAYTDPLNLSMLAGHTLDGFSSYISIYDPLHLGLPPYLEKHPASNTLLTIWPPLYPIIKILLILLIIYLFDIAYKNETIRYTRLINLLKIGILILGLSPGLRDLLRVTIGV
jgi:uncharacterized membrane protein